ncbi:MAG: alkaline phosphatase family protein [Anaeromyxobacteraceae bacterium]
MPRAPLLPVTLLASLLAAPPARAAEAPGRPGAPVAVAIVVDQLGGWLAAERWPALPGDGGFARLRREGAWVRQLEYLHANTETAPGHASLFTGRTPREHGILANEVVREDLPGRPRGSLLEDPATRLVGVAKEPPGISLARLDGDTLADALVARDPAAVVVALSQKDRGSLFAAGRRPRLAAWLDRDGKGGAAWVTTSAYPPLPAWLVATAPDVTKASPLTWDLSDRGWVASHAGTPDDAPGEDASAWGSPRFPHALASAVDGWRAYRAAPFSNDLVVDAGLAAVAQVRDPAHPMLLSLSLSGLDYVGHAFGTDSWEHWDALLRLDRTLARLLDGLDRAVGKGRYTVVLSGDHGMGPMPEAVRAHPAAACGARDRWERPCAPGARVQLEPVRAALDAAVARALGARGAPAGRYVERFVDPLVWLGPEALAALPGARGTIEAALVEAAGRIPGVAGAFPVHEGPCPAPADTSLAALACRSTRPGVGFAYLALAPGASFGYEDGMGHGSPWRYDRAVPLLASGPGIARGKAIERGTFGSYRATLWWALTGEASPDPYGGVVR